MSKFAAPAWDVDGSATSLCDNFAGGKKSFKRKADKGHNAKNNTHSSKVPSPGSNTYGKLNVNGGPRERQIGGKVSYESKQKKNNGNMKKKREKFVGNVNEGLKEQKKFVKKKFSQGKKFDWAQSPRGPSSEGYPSQKKTKKKKNLPFTKAQGGSTLGNKKFDSKSPKQGFTKSGKQQNLKKNYETQDHNVNISALSSNKGINRKRNANHLLDSQCNVQTMKKRKLDNDFSAQNVHFSSQNQIRKGKNTQIINKHKKESKDIAKVDKPDAHSTRKSSFKKIEKSQTDEMRSPYFGKNRFYDSSLSLRERMLLQLKSSRFRYINEQLYTSDSKDAEDMFKNDPDLFKVYHDGFKQQVEQWPVNPVERIIKAIQRKPENLVVADFGCGDARVAKSVPNKVHSFDLVALSNEVTVCDMAHTPLDSGTVDICVFCLSLMGTNLRSYLVEANRVLRIGGILNIAEVASRFDSVDQFVRDMKKYGFTIVNKDLSHDLFFFLNFRKVSDIKNIKSLPSLSLKPCWYKKR